MWKAWSGGIGPWSGGMTNNCPSVLDTVGWVIWPIKIVPNMTYNVFGGTLNPTLLWPLVFIFTVRYIQGCAWSSRYINNPCKYISQSDCSQQHVWSFFSFIESEWIIFHTARTQQLITTTLVQGWRFYDSQLCFFTHYCASLHTINRLSFWQWHFFIASVVLLIDVKSVHLLLVMLSLLTLQCKNYLILPTADVYLWFWCLFLSAVEHWPWMLYH